MPLRLFNHTQTERMKSLIICIQFPPYHFLFSHYKHALHALASCIHPPYSHSSCTPHSLRCSILRLHWYIPHYSGSITVITAFSGSQINAPITVTTPLGITPLFPATTTKVAVSIISFQSIMSVELIFNTTVLSVSPTSLQVTFAAINATYFKSMQLHYMAAQHPYIDILRGCFYCGNTLTGNGYRF